MLSFKHVEFKHYQERDKKNKIDTREILEKNYNLPVYKC